MKLCDICDVEIEGGDVCCDCYMLAEQIKIREKDNIDPNYDYKVQHNKEVIERICLNGLYAPMGNGRRSRLVGNVVAWVDGALRYLLWLR